MKPKRALPLGKPTFTKTPHLPGSRTGSADRVAPPNIAQRCLERAQPGDDVVVQEKLDGSCVAVAKLNGQVVALGREGWRAAESNNPGRRMFARWVEANRSRFEAVLREGEWLVGEWLTLVHGTRYQLTHEPFVVFDMFTASGALSLDGLSARLGGDFAQPKTLHRGTALSIVGMESLLGAHGHHGAIELAEGAVWRVERENSVLLRAKYVRHGKVDGAYLPENSGRPALWNWTDGHEV